MDNKLKNEITEKKILLVYNFIIRKILHNYEKNIIILKTLLPINLVKSLFSS